MNLNSESDLIRHEIESIENLLDVWFETETKARAIFGSQTIMGEFRPGTTGHRKQSGNQHMLIRLLDESNDLTDLRRCVIEIQDYERTMVPTKPGGESICTEYISQMLENCENYAGHILVAVVNERVAGYVSVFTRMVSHEIIDGNEEFGEIGDLVVLEQCRGRGLGRQLMEEAQELARAKGVSDLRIGVLGQNETAISLYRSLGFDVFSLQFQKRV